MKKAAQRQKRNTLYRVFYTGTNGKPYLVYIGRTKQDLRQRLLGHFKKRRYHLKLDANLICRVEHTEFNTEADLFVHEIYQICKYKPFLNKDDKPEDSLTFSVEEPEFKEYDTAIITDIINKHGLDKSNQPY